MVVESRVWSQGGSPFPATSKGAERMPENVLARSLDQFAFGSPVTFANLTMLPLLHRSPREAAYLTLDEALATGRFRITEVSEAGRVPDLLVRNDLDTPVLLIDGEELVGAKQNRVVNLTILVPPGTTLTIPVSCVEAGRWRHVSPAFAASRHVHFAQGRARKVRQVSRSLEVSGEARADQGDVWNGIEARLLACRAEAPTLAMADLYDVRHDDLETCVQALQPAEGQVGAAFAIGGRLAGVEWFDAPSTLSRALPKIVRSYALDAAWTRTAGAPAPPPPVGPDAVREFVERLGAHQPRTHSAVGLGEALRWEAPGMAGAALLVDDRLIHFVGFALADQGAR
jgi:hypothetical protein